MSRLTAGEELKLAIMDLDKEIYKIKQGSTPTIKYISGLLEYIEKLQLEAYAIPCGVSGGCVCLNHDLNNGTSCKINGVNFNPNVGCKYYSSVGYYRELIEGRRMIHEK